MKSFITCCLLFCVSAAYAQEGEGLQAKKFEDVEWYSQSLFKFNPTKYDSALIVLKNHLVPAAKEAGLDMQVYSYMTGEWQVKLLFRLDEGPGELEWEVPPKYVDLVNYLNTQEGGNKAFPFWITAVAEAKSDLVMKRIW